MRVAVFGASGATNRSIVDQALEEGHEVSVLVRDPAAFGVRHERLKALIGGTGSAWNVEDVVCGKDAVISVLVGRTGGGR